MELTLEILLHFIADLKPEYIHGPADPGLFVGVKQFFAGMDIEQPDGAQYLYIAGLEELLENRGRITADMTVLAVKSGETGFASQRKEAVDAAADPMTGAGAADPMMKTGAAGTMKEADAAGTEGLPCTLILVEDCALPYLLNRMIDVFSVMTNCDKAMHIAALEGQSVQALLDLCEDLLGHPTIIFDSSFDVLAYTKHIPCGYDLFCETIRNGYTDYEVMQRLQENRIFTHLKEGEALVAPAMGAEHLTNIYLKFSGEQALLGYASVHFGEDTPDPGYLDMLRLFMENVRFCLKRDFEGSHYGQMMYETFLLNLMNPAGLSRERLAEQARNVGDISLTGRYVLAVIEFPEEENVPLQFLTRLLAREMWNVRPFLYDGQICLLKTMGEDTEPDRFIEQWEKENIVRLLGERRFAMGVSNAFYELKDLRYAYLQARAALDFGDKEECCILYGDICYDHLFSLLEREMPVRFLQPEFYRQMKAYDAGHGTEYLRILLTYFACGYNATGTAERLFLHRNTVRNAVLFAQEHWGIRMDDPKIQKRIVLSDLADRYLEKTHSDGSGSSK